MWRTNHSAKVRLLDPWIRGPPEAVQALYRYPGARQDSDGILMPLIPDTCNSDIHDAFIIENDFSREGPLLACVSVLLLFTVAMLLG
jgi:hypothetical protein